MKEFYFYWNFKTMPIDKLFDFLELAYKNHDERYIKEIKKQLRLRGV